MPRAALFVARFCSSAWIGAAVLFVIVGILEVTRGGFDAATKDALVALRFPAFYLTGAVLVGAAWLATCLARDRSELSQRRQVVAVFSLLAVFAVMALDYAFIYQPLLAMVTPPGVEKTTAFKQYHNASKYVNLFGLGLTLVASVSLNLPRANINRPGNTPESRSDGSK
jgi:hypothetical protein